MIYHAAFSIFGPCLKAISSMSFKLSNTYLKLFIMTAAASAMLVGSECLHRLYFDIVPLGKLFKNPCSQAELNKIVPFGFSLQRQKMVFFLPSK